MVTYLTGGSGYLGGEIVRALALNERTVHAQVLVPVRDKAGKTGQERFDPLFSGGRNPHQHARWVAPAEPIPDDAEVVILNAFDVAFHKDIARVLRESVAPTLALLEECSKLSLKTGKLRKVILVSTAYVQPPLPFKRCDGPITPFHGAADPWGLYGKLLNGEMGWQDLVDDKDNDSHFTTNAYIYAKTLLEHLVATFKDLPCTYIVRPSIIGPSRCGKRGNAASPGCASAKLMDSPVGRFVPSTGCECMHGLLHPPIYGTHPLIQPHYPRRAQPLDLNPQQADQTTATCAVDTQVPTTSLWTTLPAESCRLWQTSHHPGLLPTRSLCGRLTGCPPPTSASRPSSTRANGSSHRQPSG